MSSNEGSTASTPSPQSTEATTPPQWSEMSDAPELKCANPIDAFTKWRPAYHLIAPTGWMNDPCAPGYDPKTGLYHVSFQWNPSSPDWGDIVWGSATSSDMITWTVNDQPSLSIDKPYDQKGVFTGCCINDRDGSLAYAYTSVSALPIHHTIPHPKGIESLSLAKSFDGGKSWTKIAGNPILPHEPEHLDVTGWRDPFVASWPSMSKFLGLDSENTLFGIISGGVRDLTPTTFLYSVDANDLTKWNYIGPLTNFGLNLCPSKWSGDLGRNWEVTNFLTLKDETDSSITRDFVVMGTEGLACDDGTTATGPSRPIRGQLWMSGSLRDGSSNDLSSPVDMTYNFGGHLDHGCLYAANSFFDPQTQKQIVWGWIPDDDICDALRHRQGWSGMLSMPREIYMQTVHNVVGTSASTLESITSIEAENDGHGSSTVRTLASQPHQRLIEGLRQGPNVHKSELNSDSMELSFTSNDIQSQTWELDCTFNVSELCNAVSLTIGHSEDFSKATTMSFHPQSEKFIITRPSFSTENSAEILNSQPEQAPHTLFTLKEPKTGLEQTEKLHIRAWRDKSALEVFVNGRTAISSRLYAADETYGIRFFAEDAEAVDGKTENVSSLVSATIWDNISVA